MDNRSAKNGHDGMNLRSAARAFVLVCLIAVGAIQEGRSAEAVAVPETRAFEAGRIALNDGLYDYAEKQFSEFLKLHPSSPVVPQAKLFLAQSRFHLKKYEATLTLLRENLALATDVADQYQFLMGEVLYAQGKTEEAGQAYAKLITDYPDSKQMMAAAFKQAYVFFQKQDFARTVALLSAPEAAFEQARQKDPGSVPSILGVLALSSAQFSLKEYTAAENALKKLPGSNLPPEAKWRRGLLLARVFQATERLKKASDLMPQVLASATDLMQADAMAESHSLNAEILEQLGKKRKALEAYKPNLKSGVPKSWKRQALVKTVELSLETGSAAEAIAQLELLSAAKLDEPAGDLVQLTLGELQLKQFYALSFDQREPGSAYSPAASNFLGSAEVHFKNVIKNFTNSTYLGKAWINRGWSDWQLQRWEPAANSFSNAMQKLSPSLEHAVAIFKLGDSLFRLKQYTNALVYYDKLVADYGENEVIKTELLDQVYYQIIQSGIAANDLDVAIPAMQALMGKFPGSFYADRSLLLVGQALNDVREPAGARKVFEGFSTRFGGSSLEPEVQLAIARTYELEGNWPAAVDVYSRWITNHYSHPSLPTALFGRAWGNSQAGAIANALSGFTNFVSVNPTHELTPVALQWLGDQFYSAKNYPAAELYYQKLFAGTNVIASDLAFPARVFAARAALGRQAYSEAKRYLTNVINTADCPDGVRAEALFAYGDVLMSEPSENPSRFADARGAFDQLVTAHTNSVDVPAALGRIGDCDFQLKLYAKAIHSYTQSLNHPGASIQERSQSEVKLAKALEMFARENAEKRDAILIQAMEHYLNVFYQQNVDEEKNEQPSSYWIRRAGLDAAALAEFQKNHNQAASLYQSLKEMLPQMSAFLDQRIRQQENLARRNGG